MTYDTGQTETIVADPAEDMFAGVSVNDEVVITYHQSAGQPRGSPTWSRQAAAPAH